MKPILSIIVVSYNTKALLEKCLASIKAGASGKSFETIVVDNASKDESAKMVSMKFPKAKLVANSSNKGFGAANNQAIAIASGKYLALVNSDVVLKPGALSSVVDFMDRNQKVAAASLMLFNPDGSVQPNCTSFPTLKSEILARIPFFSVPAKYFVPRTPSQVENFSGACFILRKSAVDECGAFDESFFMYLEESDLFLRLSKAGWKIFSVPTGRAIHFGGASTSYAPRRQLLYFQSLLKFFSKHYGFWQALALRKTVFIGSALTFLASFIGVLFGNPLAKERFLLAKELLGQSVSDW